MHREGLKGNWFQKNIKSEPQDWCLNPFSAGTVFRRQSLTSKYGPSTERIKTFVMTVDS